MLLVCLGLQPGGFSPNPAAIYTPEERFSLVGHFPAQSPSRIGVALGLPPFGGAPFSKTCAVNHDRERLIYSPRSASCQPGFELPSCFV